MTPDATEKQVLEVTRERRELVNDALDEDAPMAESEWLYEASRCLLKAGGKRLRPAVSLLTAEFLADVEPISKDYRAFPTLAGDSIDVMAATMSIEVTRSFTLIHNDTMDDDDLHCGVPVVYKEYDNSTAILAGDTLYAKAFELLAKTGADPADGLEAARRLATTCTQICEGQALDIELERHTEVLPDEYLQVVELETAVLYGTAAAVLAVVTGVDNGVVETLYQYGIVSGSAFQIQGDVLDLTVPSDQLGKQRGSDLVENKETIISLHTRQQSIDVDDLVDAETAEELTGDAVEAAVAELNEAGSIDYAREMAKDLTEQAKSRLDVLPDNEACDLLCDTVGYLIARGY